MAGYQAEVALVDIKTLVVVYGTDHFNIGVVFDDIAQFAFVA